METPEIKDDGCPYRSKCAELGIDPTEVCIGSEYGKCLKFQEYESEKAMYVFDGLVG
jgi:hypothetical protein